MPTLLTADFRICGDKAEVPARVLFDTGASFSFVRRDLAEMAASLVALPQPIVFTLGDGRTLEIREQVTLQLDIAGQPVLDTFMVLPLSGVEEIVLGAGTMRKFGLKIDMEHSAVFAEIKGRFMATALGDRLRALRDEKGMSNADLAEAAGISESTMQGIIAGEIARPPDERLSGFARVLGVSLEELKNLIPAEIRDQGEDAEMNTFRAKLLARLGLTAKDEMSDEQAIEQIAAKVGAQHAVPVAAPAVLAALGLPETATEPDVKGKIMALTHRADVVPAEQFNALKAEMHTRDIKDTVEGGISTGKLTPAEREWGMTEATKDLPTFKAFLQQRPKVVPLQIELPKEEPKAAALKLDDAQAAINKQLGISQEMFAKYAQ